MKSYQYFEEKKEYIHNKPVVGIDPAKKFVDCAFLNENGLSISKPKRFIQSFDGFNKLLTYSKELYPNQSPVFSIECSCRLWVKLADFLKERDYDVLIFSPLNTYHGRTGINLDYSHSDPKDATIIASGTKSGKFNFYKPFPVFYQITRNLSIHFEKISFDITRTKNRLRSKIEEFFPEFLQCLNLDTLTSIYLLERYVLPSDYLQMDIQKEAAIISKLSNRNHGMSLLLKLRVLAEQSIGLKISDERKEMESLIIRSLIDQLKLLIKQQDQLSKEMIERHQDKREFQIIRSIKGISDLSAARLLSELSGIERFRHYKQIEKYAGANLRIHQSGNSKGVRRLNKIGNKRLLKILYLILANTTRYTPELRIKYLKRQIRRPCYKKNLFATLPNLLKLIFALIKEDRLYEINEEREKIMIDLEEDYKKARHNRLNLAS